MLGGLLFGGIAAFKTGNPWVLVAMVGAFVVMGLLGAGYGQGISGGLLGAATKELRDSPMVTPHDAFRADLRRTAVAALVGAVAGSTLMGLLGFFDGSIGEGVLWGGAMGLATGWVAGLGPAWLLVAARPDVPGRPARLMPTLRSALDKQVLRQAGLVYQFRHAELQIHLQQAGQGIMG
ncbi:hypothetical protein ACFQV2_13615 [Actinokineospora soli]|uniref:Uncharacterized protein n=1 Tax=Actinokineospora soli TaxID=1048753 RepID=A0ABW2TM09_9PSEU